MVCFSEVIGLSFLLYTCNSVCLYVAKYVLCAMSYGQRKSSSFSCMIFHILLNCLSVVKPNFKTSRYLRTPKVCMDNSLVGDIMMIPVPFLIACFIVSRYEKYMYQNKIIMNFNAPKDSHSKNNKSQNIPWHEFQFVDEFNSWYKEGQCFART